MIVANNKTEMFWKF